MTLTRRLATVAIAALALAACAPDPIDTYTVEAPTDATLPPLPTTIPVADTPDDADVAEADDVVVEPMTFAPNGVTIDVRSLDNSFIQPVVEIEAGTEIQWINGGRNDHNVLPVDESLTWGVDRDTFVPGERYSHVFDQPGVYPYYCSIHGTKEAGMVGAVVVVEPA